jgi:hypothetical protein
MNNASSGMMSASTCINNTSSLFCLTVRLAAMVQPASRLATRRALNDVSAIQSEEKRVAIFSPVALIARACYAPGCHFIFVFDESLSGFHVG